MKTKPSKTRLLQMGVAAAAFAASFGATAPASANSLIGDWSAARNDTMGWTTFEMSTTAETFCYLTRVSITETDSGNEMASCEVWRNNSTGKWNLTAFLGATSDADVFCGARCYNAWD